MLPENIGNGKDLLSRISHKMKSVLGVGVCVWVRVWCIRGVDGL